MSLIITAGCDHANKKAVSQKHVGIMQLMTNPGINAIREGFLKEMKALGCDDGTTIRYSQDNSQVDNAAAQAMAKKMVNDKSDLIFAITTPTAQTCAKKIKGTTIPIVFGAVTYPVAAGLVNSLEVPGWNITGTSDIWPIAAQFDLLLQLVPTVKKIGVVYNPGETNSESNIKEVKQVCSAKGLELVTVTVSNTSEVYSAAQSLVGKCDAFYVHADNTVITAMDAVVKVSEQNQIPLLLGVSSNVEQGGFGTLGPDCFDIGVESAKIADKISQRRKACIYPCFHGEEF